MREYELEVLEQYDIEVESTRKIRGAFFIDTKEGTMLLKETLMSDRRAPSLYQVLLSLSGEGGLHVDLPVYNREGNLISISRDGSRYMLKQWFAGRECDVRREQDVLEAAGNLALLHKKMRWNVVPDEDLYLPPEGRHWREEFRSRNRELKKVRSYIRNKIGKRKFEYLYLENFEDMYRLAQCVTERLENSAYETLYKESIDEKRLVHGDYNYHNILFFSDGIATTGFEGLHFDVQILDLYYFLRKVMEKHHWKESFGEAILEAYGRERPLEDRELECIALKLAYPEKFWKTASVYYHSNKAWIPEKNIEKLLLSVTQTEEKMRFLRRIFSFHL